MADRSIARGREATWPPTAGGARPLWVWPVDLSGFAAAIAERLRAWALADVGPGRLVPWLAIAFGAGIILYFSADREPEAWAASVLFVATVVAAILVRNRQSRFRSCLRWPPRRPDF